AILYAWIRDGAPFNKKVTDLAPTDTLRMIAARQFRSQHIEHFDFPAANDLTIAALNTNYRTVTPLAKNSPALAVDFFGAAFFRAKQLQELLPVKDQVVSLNLDKMPVTENDLSTIAAFINLRRLNLDFTRITGAGLATRGRLPHLESLSLSGTGIKGNDLGRLAAITSLRKIYLWKRGIASGTITDLHNRRKDMELITGVDGDTVREKLNAPRLETEARIIRDSGITIRMPHFVPGAAIRYTLDGSDPDTGGKPYTTPFLVKDRGQF